MDEKIRLGGMALANGVLVHGPSSWACAIRTRDGELKVASEYKRLRAADVRNPLLRGPARLAEVGAPALATGIAVAAQFSRRYGAGCPRHGCPSSVRRSSSRWALPPSSCGRSRRLRA